MHFALMIPVVIGTHIQIWMQMLFGAGEFDDLFGDVCELPEVKHLLEQLVKELLTSQRGDAPSAGPTDIPAEYGPAETAYCEGLTKTKTLNMDPKPYLNPTCTLNPKPPRPRTLRASPVLDPKLYTTP